MSGYSLSMQPWVVDSTIAIHRDKVAGHQPWANDAIKLLEQELIAVVKIIDSGFPSLRTIANGRVPFVIDLLPHHFDEHGATVEDRDLFNRVISIFRRGYREFAMLKEALIENPNRVVVPYAVDEGFDPDLGSWIFVNPFFDRADWTLKGPRLLLPDRHAWAIVEMNWKENGDKAPVVTKWMRREERKWIEVGHEDAWLYWDTGDVNETEQHGDENEPQDPPMFKYLLKDTGEPKSLQINLKNWAEVGDDEPQ